MVLLRGIFVHHFERQADISHLSDSDAAEHDGRADAEAVDGFVEEYLVMDFLFEQVAASENHKSEHKQHGGSDDESSDG